MWRSIWRWRNSRSDLLQDFVDSGNFEPLGDVIGFYKRVEKQKRTYLEKENDIQTIGTNCLYAYHYALGGKKRKKKEEKEW